MQGIQRVFAVLEAVAQHQPAGVGELSKIIGLPKSTVQRHLWALADAGWIRPVGEEFTRWTLTSKALMVGQRGSREGQLREVALGPMRHLRDTTGETITLQVPSTTRDMVQIERVDSLQPVRTYVVLGQVTPMYATSGGLAYLAHLPSDEQDRALDGQLEALTSRTVTEKKEILQALKEVKERGYSVNIAMNRDGVCAVGAAIVDANGEAMGGMSISMPESRFDRRKVSTWGHRVVAAAQEIQRHL